MLLLLAIFITQASAQSCPTAVFADILPVISIRNRLFGDSPTESAARLKPEWLVTPTSTTLCDYPGIECDVSCRVVVLDMAEWWIDSDITAPWEVQAGTTIRGPLSFHLMIALEQLVLTVPEGSSGTLPGTLRDLTCSDNIDLPIGLQRYGIVGYNSATTPDEPNDSFETIQLDGNNFFRNVLTSDTCYTATNFFLMTGFTAFQGVYTFDPISTENVIMIDLPAAYGSSLRAEPIDNLVLINTGLWNLDDSDFCDADIDVLRLTIFNQPNFFILPFCFLQSCKNLIAYAEGGGLLVDLSPRFEVGDEIEWLIADNDVCRIGQDPSEDGTLLGLTHFGYQVQLPSVGYQSTANDVDCYIERDRRDCINCITGEETYNIYPVPVDLCGVCNGTNACLDCRGEPFGSFVYDACDVCNGDDTSCADCNGTPNGSSTYDNCDVCNGDDNECRDCAGVPFGTFQYDSCDVCNGGDVCRIDCRGILFGTSTFDLCGVCDGDNACVDCLGVPFGTTILDICGVCGGNNACSPCDPGTQDVCGVCLGDGSSCVDCLGVVFGTAQYDACDICEGDNSECADCGGVPNGTRVNDVCGVCGGDGTSCIGCDGEVNGPEFDLCGVCGGANECLDCEGVPNGLASYDECAVCDGDNSSCTDCRGIVNGGYAVNACGECVPAASIDPNVIECDPEQTASSLSTTMWILFGVFAGLVLLTLICCCCCWWIPAARRRRRRRQQAPIRGNLNTPMATLMLVTLMASGVEALSSTVLYQELCETTNIASVLPGACPVVSSSISACDATASGFRSSGGLPLFVCHSGFVFTTAVKEVYLDLVPNLRGTISRRAWQSMQTAETLRISGDITTDFPIPVDDDDLLPQLRVETLDDDDAFTNFVQLETLVLRNLRTNGVIKLWPSLGTQASRLEHLELTNIVTLGGRFDHANVLCSFAFLKRLVITGSQLTGNPLCDRYQLAWFNLEEINLRGNRLIGRVPNLFPLPFLKIIALDSNQMSGAAPIPNELPPKIQQLSLINNDFSGSLPGLWSGLTRLEVFAVDHNRLSGSVPVLDPAGLKKFSVSFNQFTGQLPSQYQTFKPDTYELFAVNDNLLAEPWPPFNANKFVGPCSFEHNAVCRPRPAHPYSLFDAVYTEFDIARCTYSFEDTNLCPSAICGDRTCLGCDGIANSGLVIDACGLCGGNGNACRDCRGVQHGSSVLDVCGVCDGDASTCDDCAGVAAGSSRYDACGVCGGDSSSCADCLGIPRGPARLDACGECNGRNYSCSDCLGVINGTSIPDEWGVCNGNGLNPPPGYGNQLTADLASLSAGGVWFFLILMLVLLVVSVIFCALAVRSLFKTKQ